MLSGQRTYIYRSREQADAALKRMADSGVGFAASADTPFAFVREQWDVWGDGRSLVASLQRMALVHGLLMRHPNIEATPGSVAVISSFIERTSGTDELDRALLGRYLFEGMDSEVLAIVDEYFKLLSKCGLVEIGEAARRLEDAPLAQDVHMRTMMHLPHALMRLLGSSDEAAGDYPEDDFLASKQVRMRFAEATGPAAILSSVAGLVEEMVESGLSDILVFSPNAERAFGQLAGFAVERGISITLEDRVPLSRTGLGRFIRAAQGLLGDDGLFVEHATDMAYSPWSGIDPLKARSLDAQLRGDRSSDAHRALELLRRDSSVMDPVLAVIEGHATDDDLIALRSALDGSNQLGAADLNMESKALEMLCDAIDQMRSIGADHAVLSFLLDAVKVPSCKTAKASDGECASVTIRDIGSMSCAAPASFDAVVVSDVSEGALGAVSHQDCLTSLEEEIGLVAGAMGSDEAREAFAAAVRAARSVVACVMPLRDTDGKEAYPSFVIEELLSQMLEHPVDVSEVSDAMRRADPLMQTTGEDDFAASVGKCLETPCEILSLRRAKRGELESLDMARFMKCVDVHGRLMPVLSPSAIEEYMHCPYSWFIARRIRPVSLDAGFSSLERGTFVHEVMARFYELGGISEGVRCDLRPDRDVLLDAAFDSILDLRSSSDRGSVRYVPRTQSEWMETEQLRVQLHSFVRFLTALPDSYAPKAIELPISEKERICYGNAVLNGRVDRVDADASGSFAVLDYKGSISDHSVSSTTDDSNTPIPKKLQALIYAQALRRMDSSQRPVAALYLSYRAKRLKDLAAGAFDPSLYDARAISSQSSQAVNMESLLDHVEDAVGVRIDALMEGDVSISPSIKGACEHCAFAWCEGGPDGSI